MTFLHKLSQRLARMRASVLIAAVLLSCEAPVVSGPQTSDAARLTISPQSATVYPNQMTNFTAVAFTAAGDTATSTSVIWTSTGGAIIDTSTSGGKHNG